MLLAVVTLLAFAYLLLPGIGLGGSASILATRFGDVVIVLWCLWVAASIGSFLNVVAWRMPRGETIGGRSRCPRCRVQLRARDNFPVIGWLALGGRCRTCRLPISRRYPIVEAIVGITIAVLAIGELSGFSIPFSRLRPHTGDSLLGALIDTPTLVLVAYHTVCLSCVWGMALIRFDRNRLPLRLTATSLVFAVLPILVYPALMVVPWQFDVPDDWRSWTSSPAVQWSDRLLDAVARIITALVAAIFIARAIARGICPTADPKIDPLGKGTAKLIDLIAILAVPIVVFGWQSSPAITVMASAPFRGRVIGQKRRAAITIAMVTTTVEHIRPVDNGSLRGNVLVT